MAEVLSRANKSESAGESSRKLVGFSSKSESESDSAKFESNP